MGFAVDKFFTPRDVVCGTPVEFWGRGLHMNLMEMRYRRACARYTVSSDELRLSSRAIFSSCEEQHHPSKEDMISCQALHPDLACCAHITAAFPAKWFVCCRVDPTKIA